MILAIDDDALRYAELRRRLGLRETAAGGAPELHVATCPACVGELLPRASAALLDYDLDWTRDDDNRLSASPCPRCGAAVVDTAHVGAPCGSVPNLPRFTGEHYLDDLDGAGVPVIVSSCNRVGAHRLKDRLASAGVRVAMIRAFDSDATDRWIAALWAWGVL